MLKQQKQDKELNKNMWDKAKKYILMFSLIPLLIGVFVVSITNFIFGNPDCLMDQRVKKIAINSSIYKKGKMKNNHEMRAIWTNKNDVPIEFYGDLIQIYNQLSVGDSLVKNQNELIFYIHKNDTVIVEKLSYNCNEDDFYLDF